MESRPEDKSAVALESPDGVIAFKSLVQAATDSAREWKPFLEGVEISRLYTVEGGMASAFLHFAAGAKLVRHCHEGYEHIFVLRGSQRDENGIHPAGSMLMHPPGTCHTVSSPEGCFVFAIWEKPVIFQNTATMK